MHPCLLNPPSGAARKIDLITQPTTAEIHLWLTSCEAISDERLLVSFREVLNATAKKEESRFYFARDRHRCLVTRALVRTVLSRYDSVDPKDWVFLQTPTAGPTSLKRR